MQTLPGDLTTIDVGSHTDSRSDIEGVSAHYLGGRGVATRLAHERIPFDADPLGEENRIYISAGPLQGAVTSFTGRMNMTGLSPLTNGLVSSNAGGYVSRNFLNTGNSAVEIVGTSNDLIAIHVRDNDITIEKVPELAKAKVSDVTKYMNERHGLGAENLIAIGPAGENRVRFASVMTSNSRAFGRGGLGAVLGAKNVKAVSFDGDDLPDLTVDPELSKKIQRGVSESDNIRKRQGTTYGTETINENFSLPTRYFSEQMFEDADHIGGRAIEAAKNGTETCSVCALACKLPTKDEKTGLETEGPEFETTFSLGSNVGVGNLPSIMKSNELCDQYGLDTISTGDVIAAYLAANDEFGNEQLVHELIDKITNREGVGEMLAEGIDRFHDELSVENWSVKGMEFPAHDGRVLHGQGLSYAVANRGADHMYSTMLRQEYGGTIDPKGLDAKPSSLVQRENQNAIRDSAVLCAFGKLEEFVTFDRLADLLDTSTSNLSDIGERIVTLERHFNNMRGFDRTDDRLPYDLPGFDAALDEYYSLRGWEDGIVPDTVVDDALYGEIE